MIALIRKLLILIIGIMLIVPMPGGAFSFTSKPCQVAPNNPACVPGTTNPVLNIINATATIIASAAGIAAVIMVILGGYGFITSGGNPEAVKKARLRIIYGLIGVAVVALSWTIIRFITDNFIK